MDGESIPTSGSAKAADDAADDSAQAVKRAPPKNKVPRLYHNKSRTGCQRCRARRVKCSETHPVCSGCSRHGVDCVYDRGTGPSKPSMISLPRVRNSERRVMIRSTISDQNCSPVPSQTLQKIVEIPENRSRRLLELRLFYNFTENTSLTLVGSNDPIIGRAWKSDVPRIALKHESLLYEIFSMSALHLLRLGHEDCDLRSAQLAYQSMANNAINIDLDQVTSDTADVVWFASLLLQMNLFASMQDRNLEPYIPPLKWLEVSHKCGYLTVNPPQNINKLFSTNVIAIIQSNPNRIDQDQLFSACNRESIIGLLTLDRQEEMWDIETQQAYEHTLSYIGSIRKASIEGEHSFEVARRIIDFPNIVPIKFIKFVEKQHPRALAMLASFFSIASKHSEVWWMGATSWREFQAIRRILPHQWHQIIGL